jgi:hypothetical protein
MFRSALKYWRGCDGFLRDQQRLEAESAAGGAGRSKPATIAGGETPQPPGFPVSLPWLLNHLFEGDRDRLRHYIQYCQFCGVWPKGDTESFITPLEEGADVESYQFFTRHWHEWRRSVTSEGRRGTATGGSAKKSAKKAGPGKTAKKKK